jgi:histidine triad (HIT) family protein
MTTIFTKIINSEIPSTKVYEDEKCIAILDINPNNKGHTLVIPKEEYETILDCPKEVLHHLIDVVKMVSAKMEKALGCDGINISINNKPAAGQEIAHIHIHVIPRYNKDGYALGRHLKYNPGEMAKYGQMLKIN